MSQYWIWSDRKYEICYVRDQCSCPSFFPANLNHRNVHVSDSSATAHCEAGSRVCDFKRPAQQSCSWIPRRVRRECFAGKTKIHSRLVQTARFRSRYGPLRRVLRSPCPAWLYSIDTQTRHLCGWASSNYRECELLVFARSSVRG